MAHGRAAYLTTVRNQTVHPATRHETDCACGDNQRPFRAARCRQMHSLGRGASLFRATLRGSPARSLAGVLGGVCRQPACGRSLDYARLRLASLGMTCSRGETLSSPITAIRREGDPSTTLAALAPLRMTRSRLFAGAHAGWRAAARPRARRPGWQRDRLLRVYHSGWRESRVCDRGRLLAGLRHAPRMFENGIPFAGMGHGPGRCS